MIPKLYITRVPTMCRPKSIEKKRVYRSSRAPIATISLKSRLLIFPTPYFSEVLRGPSPLSAETPLYPELSLSTMNQGFGLLTSKGLAFGTSRFSYIPDTRESPPSSSFFMFSGIFPVLSTINSRKVNTKCKERDQKQYQSKKKSEGMINCKRNFIMRINHRQWIQTRRIMWKEQESPELRRRRRKGSQRI